MAEYKPSEERRLRQQQGLVYYGEITTYTDPTHFKVSELAGFGDDFFKNYYVYVVRDAGGAGVAPQGEDAKKTTDYTSSDGTFTHLAFVANLAVGDEVVLLHESIALAGAGGGAYSGDIEIWDSFEYPSNASLQAKWPKSGGAASPTRSTTAFYQRYSMSIAISGAGVGEVHRAFSTPRDIGTLHNISITARSNKAAGDSFQFTLYDSAGNYSYWTQTIAAQDTWETFNIDPHSTPTADGGTPVDLDDVVELRLANLTNASTYLFDLIRFESLVSSKIGVGYDGLDDALETASSVRGHLLDITDDYLKYLTTAALGTHTGGSIGDYVKMLYGAAIGGSPTSHSAFERIKAIDDKIPSKPYLMGSADADGGFDTEAKADIEAECEDALEGENLDHLLKTNLPTNPATDIAANSALGHTMGTSDMASFDRSTDSLQSIRDSADTGYANVIKIIGEGGHNYTAQAATAPGDNVSAMGALRYIHGAIGTEYVNGNGVPEIDNIRAHLFKTGGMGGGVATKTLTFANDGAGTIALFTVTGDVVVKIIASCSTLVASGAGANVEVGIPADTDGIIATTLATDIDADEIWHDASPDSQIEALSTMREYIIVNGADIGILLSGQVDTGVITFHCIWTGLNGGTVVST